MKRCFFYLLLLISCGSAQARDCFDHAGESYNIDADLLRAISWIESRFNPVAMGRNSNSSIDIGMMQINSSHMKELATYGITRVQLANDVCMNIFTGAYYLAIAFKKWGANWNAVGAYNAGFKRSDEQILKRFHYASKVAATYYHIKTKVHRTANHEPPLAHHNLRITRLND